MVGEEVTAEVDTGELEAEVTRGVRIIPVASKQTWLTWQRKKKGRQQPLKGSRRVEARRTTPSGTLPTLSTQGKVTLQMHLYPHMISFQIGY